LDVAVLVDDSDETPKSLPLRSPILLTSLVVTMSQVGALDRGRQRLGAAEVEVERPADQRLHRRGRVLADDDLDLQTLLLEVPELLGELRVVGLQDLRLDPDRDRVGLLPAGHRGAVAAAASAGGDAERERSGGTDRRTGQPPACAPGRLRRRAHLSPPAWGTSAAERGGRDPAGRGEVLMRPAASHSAPAGDMSSIVTRPVHIHNTDCVTFALQTGYV
jgi:hypothetical protein